MYRYICRERERDICMHWVSEVVVKEKSRVIYMYHILYMYSYTYDYCLLFSYSFHNPTIYVNIYHNISKSKKQFPIFIIY
jgi:hypothetical protein